MSDWERVGTRLRASKRREVASAPHRERCEGCGNEVERTANVLVDATRTAGTDYRTGQPVYAFDAYRALCSRCARGYEP